MALTIQDTIQEGVISAFQSYAANAVKSVKRDILGKTKSTASNYSKQSSITLIVEAAASGTISQTVAPTAANSAGTQPTTKAVPLKSSTVLAQLTFDVWSGSDGFVQSTSETFSSHESVHITAAGFYIDQFNLSPGKLSMSVIAVGGNGSSGGYLVDQIKGFMDVLRQAKQSSSPLQPKAAPLTRYVNTVDGRSLLLSQTDLTIRESAELPNQIVVDITGTILVDYAYPLQVTLAAQQLATAQSVAVQLAGEDDLYQASGLNTDVAGGVFASA